MLTWDEDCAYRRMLDVCYETERDLPRELEKIYALVRASTVPQKQAVEKVLKTFFKQRGGKGRTWHQQRVSKQIAKYQQLQAKRVNAAKDSWLPSSKRYASAEQVQSSLNLQSLTNYKTLQPPAPRGGSDLTQHVSASRQGSGQRQVLVQAHDGQVLVTKPANRRLWTNNEREAMHGATAARYIDFFHNKGYQAELFPNGELKKE